QELIENIRLQQIGFTDPNLGPANLTQNLSIPTSHLTDPGLFADLRLPATNRLTLTGGARTDFTYTNSDPRLINGNIIIAPGTQAVPTIPGQIAPPSAAPTTTLDPILFSSRYFDPNLARHFTTWAAFAALDYKIDDH